MEKFPLIAIDIKDATLTAVHRRVYESEQERVRASVQFPKYCTVHDTWYDCLYEIGNECVFCGEHHKYYKTAKL